MKTVQLPVTNESGYYEIRLESIGGLGANLCGKMLGELGMKYLGLNSACFSSYGSEKTGTPVKGFIRFCRMEQEIRVHSPVTHPHLLAIFHEALLEKQNVLEGISRQTKVLLNTTRTPRQAAEKYNIPLRMLSCIPAQNIAMECGSRINVVMLGAMGRLMGFADLEQLEQICGETLGKKYPDVLRGNLDGIRRGFGEVQASGMSAEQDAEEIIQKSGMEVPDSEEDFPQSQSMEWGYRTAPQGGINPHFGNSVINDLSPSRQGYIPLFIQERCINCGLCDVTCPDMVFQFQKGIYKGKEMMVNKGLDYYHCKGCLRCVTICPSNALVSAKEEDYPRKPYFMANQDLLRAPDYYEESGADGYITSESFLTEKRMDGGEV